MIPRTVAALTLAAVLGACALNTPAPALNTPGPIVARLALPVALQWQRADWRTPSLLAYPRPSEAAAATVGAYP